jgi:hypothetical protein
VNANLVKAGSKEAARHPLEAWRLSVLAVRYRQALMDATRAAQSAARLGAAAKQAAANPKVQAETRRAAARLVLAARRAREVGVANASGDKQIATELRRAREHAARAIIAARYPKPKRHLVRTTLILTGAGGAAYAGWRVYARPQLDAAPAWPDTTGTEDGAQNRFEATDGAPPPPEETPAETPADEPGPE